MYISHYFLSPGQTESQVDTSWKPGSTCDSIWPGLARTCVDLRWLALTLVKIEFASKLTKVFHRLTTQPKSRQNWVTSINLLLANEIQDMFALKWVFLPLAFTCEETCRVRFSTQCKSLCEFNLPLLLASPSGCGFREFGDIVMWPWLFKSVLLLIDFILLQSILGWLKKLDWYY